MSKKERYNNKTTVDTTHASGAPSSGRVDTTARVVDTADALETAEPAVPATEELPWDWESSLGIAEHAHMYFDSGGVFFLSSVSSSCGHAIGGMHASRNKQRSGPC